ncbi:hypothetical protein DL771_010529 [Monosporascus sp. 5C6A]|nr:hypothetical protein DL771_010529 [Monosporascus sp. 5C6A]
MSPLQVPKFVNFHGEMSPKQFKIRMALGDVLKTMHRIEQQQMPVIQETRPSDWQCPRRASNNELQANDILQILKRTDVEKARNVRNHFLETRDLLGQSDLLQIMQDMPKGGQLHVHFNACLPPENLLDIAASMKRMFITSDRDLLTEDDYNQSEIQFQILSEEREGLENLFERHKMRFQDFLHKFPREKMGCSVMQWLISKLVFQEGEVYKTPEEAWRMFNIRTRMIKGLFNYETAFKHYTRLFLEKLQGQGFQYAEIRPNFMNTNQLWSDDGNRQFTNQEMMEIIIHEYGEFQRRSNQALGGLKVIYCTPRSFSKENVKASLKECLDFKLRWPKWIAGFDLVGEESKGHKLKYFLDEFMEFRVECEEKNVDIPFLFHCGETKDDPDGNLLTALALGAKRVAHGFALPQRPVVMEQMVERGTSTLARDFYEVFLHTEALRDWLTSKKADVEIDKFLVKSGTVPPWAMDDDDPMKPESYLRLTYPLPNRSRRNDQLLLRRRDDDDDGYGISASRNRGYRYQDNSIEELTKRMDSLTNNFTAVMEEVRQQREETNQILKRLLPAPS